MERERLRVADMVLGLVSDLSLRTPLVLVLEDLHWADEGTLFAFKYLSRNLGGSRVLLLCTCRPEGQSLQRAVRELDDASALSVMNLEGLDRDGVVGLIDSFYPGNAFPREFAEELWARCEGNPFFVRELLWQMREEGKVSNEGERFELVDAEYSIPDSVEEVVQRRLGSLGPEAMAMAEYASCIGKSFDVNAAESLGSLEDPRSALEELESGGIIALREDKGEFAHALFQDITYKCIGDRWLLAYHRSLGEHYESAYEGRLNAVLYELARHFSRARVAEKACDYGLRAAEKAEAAYAPEQALEFYRGMLEAIPGLRGKESLRLDRSRVMARIGQNLQLLGRLDEAEGVYREALALARAKGDSVAMAELSVSLGSVLIHKPEYDEAKNLSELAFKRFSETGDAQGMFRALGNLGYVHFYKGEYDQALDCHNEQIGLAEGMGDRLRVGRALSDIGGIYWDTGRYEEAMDNNRRYLEIAEELGDKHAMKDALSGMANVAYYQKDYGLARESYQRLVDLSRESGDLFMEGLGLIGLGATNEVLGDFEDARLRLLKALDLSGKMGYKQGLPYVHIYLGRMNMHLGEYAQARESFQLALDISESIQTKRTLNFAQSSMGYLCKRLGEYEEAESLYLNAIAIARELDNRHVLCDNLQQLADVYFLTGRFEEAKALNDEALPLAEGIDRDNVVHNCRVLDAKLLAGTSNSGAIAKLESLLAKAKEEKERADVLYELFKLTGDRKTGGKARDLYLKMYESVPDVVYKERAGEMGDG